MKIYHNVVPHDLRWRKLNARAWKDAAIRFSVLQFFSFHPIQCRSSTLGRKTKIRGSTQFYCSFNRKGTLVVPFMFGENVMSRRESWCTELRVPPSLTRFKKDWVIDVESLYGPSSELDNFHFLVSNDGHGRTFDMKTGNLTHSWGEILAEYIQYILLEISPKSNGRVLEMKGVNALGCFLKRNTQFQENVWIIWKSRE